MSQLFHLIIYRPLFNALMLLYGFLPGHDVGVVIIVFGFLIKAVFYPLTKKTMMHQQKMQAISPHLKKLKDDHKGKPEDLAKATMELYKEHQVKPLDGCLPLLIQIPLLIGLFQVFRTGFMPDALKDLYGFVPNPGTLHPFFLGIIDLSKKNIYMPLLAGAAQFVYGRFFTPKPQADGGEMAQMMAKQMVFMGPFLTFFISLNLPSVLPFYWFVNNVFSVLEGKLIQRAKDAQDENAKGKTQKVKLQEKT